MTTAAAIQAILEKVFIAIYFATMYHANKIDRRQALESCDDPVLPLQVLKKFRLIYGSVRQHFREVEQTCGVSGSQLWVLQEVANRPGIGVSEVAQRLSIHQSTCSQLVEKLVGQGLMVKARSLEDQRRVGLNLSDKAREILPRAPSPTEGVLPKALMSVPDETLRALDAALAEVIGQLRLRDEAFADKPLADM